MFGLGTAALWLRSLNRPLSVDADGLTLRYHRRLPWSSIKKIGISRSYLDGHVSEMRIHHRGGVSKIKVRELRDGEKVVGMVLTMFKLTRRAGTGSELRANEPAPDITRFVGGDCLRIPGRYGRSPSTSARHPRENRNGDCQCGSEAAGRLQRRKCGPPAKTSGQLSLGLTPGLSAHFVVLKSRVADLRWR